MCAGRVVRPSADELLRRHAEDRGASRAARRCGVAVGVGLQRLALSAWEDTQVQETVSIGDPTPILRARDGLYADELLIVAVGHLDLFTRLAAEPCGFDDFCRRFGVARRPADVMCTLFRAMGLLEEGTLVRPAALATDYLVRGSPLDLGPYLASLAERASCLELLEVLRNDRPAPWASAPRGSAWMEGLGDPAFAARITAAMDARGASLAPAMADAIADLGFSSVLDVAGGSGIYSCALLDRHPRAVATVFERSPVDAVARTLLGARNYDNRVRVVAGDMFAGLPSGHDLHLLSHTLHDWDEEGVRRIVDRCFVALTPGGWLVDHDTHLNREKTGPLAVARYSVLLMHGTQGRCWSVAELEAVLVDVGFVEVEERPAAADRSVIVARKPG
ncbi:MAG: methyltransferase [Actinobacteria bacterium]|nr:methyltransferase [Actinomycetota bacterium]